MTTLTLIYAANSSGDFTDKDRKCWNMDRGFFRETIRGKPIICGRKTFEQDAAGLKKAARVIVLSKQNTQKLREHFMRIPAAYNCGWHHRDTILEALSASKHLGCNKEDEVYCVGGKQTIESLAPFASRILLTHIREPAGGKPWLPKFIQREFEMRNEDGKTLWQWEGREVEEHYAHFDVRRAQPIEF